MLTKDFFLPFVFFLNKQKKHASMKLDIAKNWENIFYPQMTNTMRYNNRWKYLKSLLFFYLNFLLYKHHFYEKQEKK